MADVVHYFVLFAIILTTLANPLAQVYRDRPRSHSVDGHTSEINEPTLHDDSRNCCDSNHHGKPGGQDGTHNHNNDLTAGSRPELDLDKPSGKPQNPIIKHPKVHVHNDKEKKPCTKETAKAKGNTANYNFNSNVNRLNIRGDKNIKEDENDDAVDDSDLKASGQLAVRFFPQSDKYNPPPIYQPEFGPMGGPTSGNYRKSSMNLNKNVNDNVINSGSGKKKKEKIRHRAHNHARLPTDFEAFEEKPLVVDAEITSDKHDSKNIDDSSSTQEVKVSSIPEHNEPVTTTVNSVTDISELSGSNVHADDKHTRPSKQHHHRHHDKPPIKKINKTHRMHHKQHPISEKKKIQAQQESQLSIDNNVESTTSIVGTVQGISKPSIVGSSGGEETESKPETKIQNKLQGISGNSSKVVTQDESAGESSTNQVDQKNPVEENHNEDFDDKLNEEKNLLPPGKEGAVKPRKRHHRGRLSNYGENTNLNVNTNTNKLDSNVRRSYRDGYGHRHRHSHTWDRMLDEPPSQYRPERDPLLKNRDEFGRNKKVMHRGGHNNNVNSNKNVNTNTIGSTNPKENEIDFGDNRRSIPAPSRFNNRNRNENINSNTNINEQFDGEDDEVVTSYGKPQGTRLDIYRDSSNRGFGRGRVRIGGGYGRGGYSHAVGSGFDLLNNVLSSQQQQAQSYDTGYGYRRKQLHKRHDDSAYAEQ